MPLKSIIPETLRNLTADGRLLFATRIARLFAYGFLSVILVLYLVEAGLNEPQIGLLITLTLVGDTIISLWITTSADRIGRRNMLMAGAILMVFAGVLFAVTRNFVFLLIAATIGVISPSGNEVGPFLSIEQSALSQIVSNEQRTQVFAWYNLVGSFTTALGSLSGGVLVQALQGIGVKPLGSYRAIVMGYAIIGAILGLLFTRLSSTVEIPPALQDPYQNQKDFWVFTSHARLYLSYRPSFPSMPLQGDSCFRASSHIGFPSGTMSSRPFWEVSSLGQTSWPGSRR